MADPLLSLQTLAQFPTVEIDGTRYPLTPADALPLVKLYRLDALREQIAAIAPKAAGGRLSDAESLEAELAVDELARMVLEAPAAVFTTLTTLQKLQIAQAFIGLPPTHALPTAAEVRGMQLPTGARSSRPSAGSTARARSTGSPRSRSRSSARAS